MVPVKREAPVPASSHLIIGKDSKAREIGNSRTPKAGAPTKSRNKTAANSNLKVEGSTKTSEVAAIQNTSSSKRLRESFEEGRNSDRALQKQPKLTTDAVDSLRKNESSTDEIQPKDTTAKKSKKKILKCLLCQERGHPVKDCPKNEVALLCHKCGKSDHFARMCSIKEEVFTFAVCFVCRQTGHLGRNCPTKPQAQVSDSSQVVLDESMNSQPLSEVLPVHETKEKVKPATVNTKDLAKKNAKRFARIREELNASGKTPEEIEREFTAVQRSILKKSFFIRCHQCQERGHGQKDCPGGRQLPKCHKCGKTSHFSKACPVKEEVYTYAVCFLCRQTGHLGKYCPNNTGGNVGPCFICNEKTHNQKDCPQSHETNQTGELAGHTVQAGESFSRPPSFQKTC